MTFKTRVKIGKVLSLMVYLVRFVTLLNAPFTTFMGVLLLFIGKDMINDMKELEKIK